MDNDTAKIKAQKILGILDASANARQWEGLIAELMDAPTEIIANGYTRAELEAAFKLVQAKDDWKAPIRATILHSQMDVVASAIRFFTATEPTFHTTPCDASKPTLVLVLAAGYRAGPAN